MILVWLTLGLVDGNAQRRAATGGVDAQGRTGSDDVEAYARAGSDEGDGQRRTVSGDVDVEANELVFGSLAK